MAAAASAAPTAYAIDPTHTFPSFEADHMGISVWRGKLNKRSGQVLYDKTTGTGTVEIVTELAHGGDEVARMVLGHIGRQLGVGLTNISNIFNPQCIVVGGGAMAAGELLLEPARAELAARGLRPNRDVVKVVAAKFEAEAGMLGAAVLAFDELGIETG